MRIVKRRSPVIVPVRQSWGVIVDNYAPEFQVTYQTWVHLVGSVTRDVC